MPLEAPPSRPWIPLSLCVALLAGCGSGGSGSGGQQAGIPGTEATKPTGELFFVDANRSGDASRITIEEMFWGRLVDVHDIDAFGQTNPDPIFRDFVINETTRTDISNYVVDTNPITQRVRLIIQRTKGAPDTGTGTFDDLLEGAIEGMPPISPHGDRDFLIDNPNEDADVIARNATLVIRFSDLLGDGINAENLLPATVKVLTDYPPQIPFTPRMRFDPNHGGVVGGAFHSTRILIDMTVSEEEATSASTTAPINNLGLPRSIEGNDSPNIAVRIPTRLDVGSGQFAILRNLSGAGLSTGAVNGPVDLSVPTVEVVRGMRSGRASDENNGFLADLNRPQILGSWPVTVTFAGADPAGTQGFDFVLAAVFTTPCRGRLDVGDVISIGGRFLEVREKSGDPDVSGEVDNVRVRVLGDTPVAGSAELLGGGLFQSTYDPQIPVLPACWVSFTPGPGTFPATDLDPISVVGVDFTEPMDPATVLPFQTFSLIRGSVDVQPSSSNTVVGEIIPSPDLRSFTFDPVLNLAHQQTGEQYTIQLQGVKDLAGNELADELPFVLFNIDPAKPPETNGGVVLRFDSVDEVDAVGANDLRGQFFYDFSAGVIRPRPVSFTSAAADRTNPVPAAMVPITTGIQTPLVPLGSKLHMVWRYTEFGWQVEDETKYNLDVVGLDWSPIGGQVLGDFIENFEMRLSHSARLPDEESDGNLLPTQVNSGLVPGSGLYNTNILGGADAQVVVHPRSLGYRVNPSDLFTNGNGTFLLPYPLNRGLADEDKVTYTWRDTANLSLAANAGLGIPTGREVQLGLDPGPTGRVAKPGEVPTIGLPLLIEIRTFPSTDAIGLNALDISIANNNSIRPFFRNFSSGGFDTMGQPSTKNPDAESSPSGGFNPTSSPPGATTPAADPVVYIGQLDYVTRISRVHTVWIDTKVTSPDYFDPIIEPVATSRPVGTDLAVDFRGAFGFDVLAGVEPFDATMLTSYGDPRAGVSTVDFVTGSNTWFNDVDSVDGARFLQMRFSFTSNIATKLRPELSAIGVAFGIPD